MQDLNKYINRLLFLVILLSTVLQLFFIFNTIQKNASIYELGFGFGSYIENIINNQQYKSNDCWFSISLGQEECLRSSRMPALPLVVSLLGLFSKNQITVAIVKASLFELIQIFLCFLYIKRYPKHKLRPLFFTGFIVIFLSPMFIKHSVQISYEEGFIFNLLPYLIILFLLCCCDLVGFNLSIRFRKIIWPSLLMVITILFFFKSSLIVIFILSWILAFIFYIKHFKSKIFCLMLAFSFLTVSFWGIHNYIKGGHFSLGTSWDGENLFRGNNTDGYKIYPMLSLDNLMVTNPKNGLGGIYYLKTTELPSYSSFKNEWAWDNFYKKKSISWIEQNPKLWLMFTAKKIYVLFITLKHTPYQVHAYEEDNNKNIRILLSGFSLFILRISEFIFLMLSIKNILTGKKQDKVLLLLIFSFILAYSLPYIIGFAYERHSEGLLPLFVIANIFLVMISQSSKK